MPLPTEVLGAPVRHAPVPDLADGHALSELVRVTEDEVRFEQDGLRVLVRRGDEVIVDWDPGADQSILEALLYGMAPRLVMLHRGTFSLHASLVVLDGRAVAVSGHSGAGKSTTTVELARRHDGQVVVDDVLPLQIIDGQVVAVPFDRPVHLTDQAFERAGIAPGTATRVGRGELTKLAVPLARAEGPVPVHQLVVLVRTEDPVAEPVVATELRGAERLRQVVRMSNVSGLASFGSRGPAYFAWSTSVASALPTIEVVRADGADTLGTIVDLVVQRLRGRPVGSPP